jgi:hypothetical protein
LHFCTELLHHRLHRIEIDPENLQILELRICGQFIENGILRLAGGAPVGVDFDQYGTAREASSENGTAVPAQADDCSPAVASAVARIVPLKTLRVKIIVSSVVDLRSQTPVHHK